MSDNLLPAKINELVFVDVETSGLEPEKDHLLEVAYARWSIRLRSMISSTSIVVFHDIRENAAMHINGISPALVRLGLIHPEAFTNPTKFLAWPEGCLIVAHNADFDRKWIPEWSDFRWICSQDDMDYPRPSGSRGLVPLALAHGVGVLSAHRALNDVLTLMRLFERVAEIDDAAYDGDYPGTWDRFEKRLAKCLRPKSKYAVRARDYDEDRNKLAKSLGFRWDPETKVWWRKMADEDVASLPFEVELIEACQ